MRHRHKPLDVPSVGDELAPSSPPSFGALRSLLPPYRTSEGRPLPISTALLVVLLVATHRSRRGAVKKDKGEPSSAAARARGSATASERFAYRVDTFFSRPNAKALLLLMITLVLVVTGGAAHWLAAAQEEGSLLSSMWAAWRFITDGGDYDDDLAPRVVGVVLVLSGMLFFALLVGLIGESIESRLEDLKAGKHRVIESGHTLVLGWSDKLIPLVKEIALSKASEGGGGVIVVLSSAHDKAWMDETVAEELPAEELEGTQIVCRTGDLVSIADLRKVSAADASSIVVLSDYSLEPDMADARTVRCVLALRAGIQTGAQTLVELRDIDNRPTLELVARMGAAPDGGDAALAAAAVGGGGGGGGVGGGGATMTAMAAAMMAACRRWCRTTSSGG